MTDTTDTIDMTQPPYAARITEDHEVYWFASLDGEDWIGVSDDPRRVTKADIDRLMNPHHYGIRAFCPMRAARRFLWHQGAEFFSA